MNNIDEKIATAYEAEDADALDEIARGYPYKREQCQRLAADLRRIYTPADEARCKQSMAAMAAMPEEKI